MLELALKGNRAYWSWLCALAALVLAGFLTYLYQYHQGLMVTGMSRDVSWGLYIAQLTFLVGVAASAVMLVLPYYLHHYKDFGRITILGEFLAIAAVVMCMLFVTVDLGKPSRVLNIMLHPTPNSVMFWDFNVLTGYLILNLIIGWVTLEANRKQVAPPGWVKPLIYLSIPWAVSIHTVTAFLYAGMGGRGYWLTAILAPRFLASAFAAGPAVLILLGLVLRRVSGFDPGRRAIQTLAKIVTYAIILHLFFFFLEVFTVFYSDIPSHTAHFKYLYFGLHGEGNLVGWMWAALVMGFAAVALLLVPRWRGRYPLLALACLLVFGCTWIDKGLGMMAGGFIPNPLHQVTQYSPTWVELIITVGIYALGGLIVTVLYKVVLGVKRETGDELPPAAPAPEA
ncbi:MAG: polysulfide reductase NrfD [Desulfarculaceae bacterium]|nr:polysulfide reductase NrfD [Desulfarculaceae bacterium]MCF8071103.1 polysulfide reductase NrfD [Desulfarculaceae bacterium]MCF8100691.1 polysulfide reductase NrfD [Desulfarculaceae bacterium]MCF8118175.1 polysulfide reductase NrfD [Desulfarculaceae bacterium]